MRVAAIQTISTPSLSENLQRTAELLALAAQAGAELAVLPEYFVLMGLNDEAKLPALTHRVSLPAEPRLGLA